MKIAHGANARGDCKLAMSHWQLAADRGNSVGQNGIGAIYQRGCPAAGIAINYALAADWYKKAAQQGNEVAYTNLGNLYRAGAGVEKSDQQAIAHYHYAARWGYELAAQSLRGYYNMTAPEPDLLNEYRRRRAEREAGLVEVQRKKAEEDNSIATALGVVAGIALVGAAGYYAGKSGAPAAYVAPAALPPPPMSIAQAPSSTPAKTVRQQPNNSSLTTVTSSLGTTSSVSGGCSSDFSCGTGQACVKPMFQSTGVCLTKVDAVGTKQYGMPSLSSIGVRTKASCQVNTDCEVGFRCDTTLKSCVR